MTDAPNATSGKTGAFSRIYFVLLAGLIVLALGLFLFLASTRQPHGKVSGSGTQKGMVTTPRRGAWADDEIPLSICTRSRVPTHHRALRG